MHGNFAVVISFFVLCGFHFGRAQDALLWSGKACRLCRPSLDCLVIRPGQDVFILLHVFWEELDVLLSFDELSQWALTSLPDCEPLDEIRWSTELTTFSFDDCFGVINKGDRLVDVAHRAMRACGDEKIAPYGEAIAGGGEAEGGPYTGSDEGDDREGIAHHDDDHNSHVDSDTVVEFLVMREREMVRLAKESPVWNFPPEVFHLSTAHSDVTVRFPRGCVIVWQAERESARLQLPIAREIRVFALATFESIANVFDVAFDKHICEYNVSDRQNGEWKHLWEVDLLFSYSIKSISAVLRSTAQPTNTLRLSVELVDVFGDVNATETIECSNFHTVKFYFEQSTLARYVRVLVDGPFQLQALKAYTPIDVDVVFSRPTHHTDIRFSVHIPPSLPSRVLILWNGILLLSRFENASAEYILKAENLCPGAHFVRVFVTNKTNNVSQEVRFAIEGFTERDCGILATYCDVNIATAESLVKVDVSSCQLASLDRFDRSFSDVGPNCVSLSLPRAFTGKPKMRCPASGLSGPGRWVEDVWMPFLCEYPKFPVEFVREFLAHKTLLFVGDSLARTMAISLVEFLFQKSGYDINDTASQTAWRLRGKKSCLSIRADRQQCTYSYGSTKIVFAWMPIFSNPERSLDSLNELVQSFSSPPELVFVSQNYPRDRDAIAWAAEGIAMIHLLWGNLPRLLLSTLPPQLGDVHTEQGLSALNDYLETVYAAYGIPYIDRYHSAHHSDAHVYYYDEVHFAGPLLHTHVEMVLNFMCGDGCSL